MSMKPRHYQQEVLDTVAPEDNALLAMSLGTGKTATATWLAQKQGAELVLIVAPLRTFDGWEYTLKDILDVDLREVSNRRKAHRKNLDAMLNGEAGYYFIGWELMRSLNTEKRWDGRAKKEINKAVTHPFNGTEFDLLIADEVHRAANRSSQNFQVLTRIKAKRKLALSATPAGNKPVNIYGPLKFLWPDKFPAFTTFGATYFNVDLNAFSYSGYGVNYGSEKHPGVVRAMAPNYIEVKAEEVFPEMPDVNVQRVMAKMSREQRKQYEEWERDALSWLDENPVAIEMPATLDLRLKQATLGELTTREREDGTLEVTYAEDCKSGKIDALLDILEDTGDEPVVVYCHSRKFLAPLKHRLTKAGYTVSEASGDDRDGWKDFRDGKTNILIAVIEAVAEGVDGLQHRSHVEVWLSNSNSLIMNKQAQGRLHRQGQAKQVTRYLIQCRDTIDDRVVGRLNKKYQDLRDSGLI